VYPVAVILKLEQQDHRQRLQEDMPAYCEPDKNARSGVLQTAMVEGVGELQELANF
jgi:hypothetical protein